MSEQQWAAVVKPAEYWERVRASVSEGMCERCLAALEPAPYHPEVQRGSIVGWCKVCQLYWKTGPGQSAGFASGYYLEDQRRNYQQVMGYPPD